MRKEWFEYQYGYVNIDDENIYLTNTGNWSETLELKEKEKKIESGTTLNKMLIILFIILVIIASLFIFLRKLMSSSFTISGILIGIPLIGYQIYMHFKTELGPSYKISLHKITAIKLNGGNATLHFLNADNVADSVELENITEKGIEILRHLI